MRRGPLPQIVISVPCHVDWNAMTRIDREGRARFCARCARPVYDSASLTRGQLGDLIARHEGRRLPCVQLHRRPDGTIVTRDCFGLRVGRFLWLKVGLAAAAFWTWALGIHPLGLLSQRDVLPSFSSEEIIPLESEDIRMAGMLTILQPTPPKEGASLLARTPPSTDWSLLPEADRAPPLRTLEAEEEIWNPEKRR